MIDAETSVANFDMLTTLLKRLVWFEESARMPSVEEPAKFNAAMVKFVRPPVTTV